MCNTAYNRIILKFSGEALAGSKRFGIDNDVLDYLADQIISVKNMGYEVGVVLGGGNIFRGIDISEDGMDRVKADYMGMLGTLINGVALEDILTRKDINVRLMSEINIDEIAEPMIVRRAEQYFEDGSLIIFSGGTGSPFFSTDSGAALKASELKADLLVKGTKVDGVYDKDPIHNDDAKLYSELDFQTAIEKQLNVMDMTALSLCKENDIPILVYNMNEPGRLKKCLKSREHGTIIS